LIVESEGSKGGAVDLNLGERGVCYAKIRERGGVIFGKTTTTEKKRKKTWATEGVDRHPEGKSATASSKNRLEKGKDRAACQAWERTVGVGRRTIGERGV